MITKLPRHFFRRVLSEWQRGGTGEYEPYFLCNSPTFRAMWHRRDGNDYLSALAQRFLDCHSGETIYGTPCNGGYSLFRDVPEGLQSHLRTDFLRWCIAHSNNRNIKPQ